jgi:hypothetical protein
MYKFTAHVVFVRLSAGTATDLYTTWSRAYIVIRHAVHGLRALHVPKISLLHVFNTGTRLASRAPAQKEHGLGKKEHGLGLGGGTRLG